MKYFLKFFSVIIVTIAFGFYFNVTDSLSNNGKLSTKKPSTKKIDNVNYNEFINDITSRVKKDYVDEKTNKELAESAANGILSALDPHSSYLNEDDFTEMKVQTKGQFGGVGIEITMEHSLVKVVSPIEGTPAYKAGIKAGDYISKVDGESIVGLTINDAVAKLRGKPRTKVNITVLRKGEKNPIDFFVKREIIKIKAVRSEIKKDIAYIKINTFSGQAHNNTHKELRKLIKKIGKENLRGVILDLRNNPGGLLNQSVKISDLFLDKGQDIVSIKGRNKKDNNIYKDESNQTLIPNIPMAVLINEGSASASEIVAGALQDNKRAIILGTKSFGKGSVQSIIPLKKGQGAIRMTTSLYYTPSGKSIQAHGIEPDIIINDAKIKRTDEEAGNTRSEASLNGHIKNKVDQEIEKAKNSQLTDDNIDLYNKDYQLARAIDILRGVSIYKKIK